MCLLVRQLKQTIGPSIYESDDELATPTRLSNLRRRERVNLIAVGRRSYRWHVRPRYDLDCRQQGLSAFVLEPKDDSRSAAECRRTPIRSDVRTPASTAVYERDPGVGEKAVNQNGHTRRGRRGRGTDERRHETHGDQRQKKCADRPAGRLTRVSIVRQLLVRQLLASIPSPYIPPMYQGARNPGATLSRVGLGSRWPAHSPLLCSNKAELQPNKKGRR